jgi:hypothetical protein
MQCNIALVGVNIMQYTENQLTDAVTLIINTRDFCGNEIEAIQDYCADEGIQDWRGLWKLASFRANAEWNGFKKQAGVNLKYCM